MKDRPNRTSRPVPPTGRPRTPQRGAGRAQSRPNTRNRQIIAIGALVLVLAVVVGVVVYLQGNQEDAALTRSLPNEEVGHALGSATAQVVVTEWSDFQ
jgi:hypothetical protein